MKVKMRVKVMVLVVAMLFTGMLGGNFKVNAAMLKNDGGSSLSVLSSVTKVGWKKENGIWYYYNNKGIKQTGWLQWKGNWYYLNKNGSMQTGWLQWKGSWYFMNSNGSMKTGWLQWKGDWYFLNSSGAMVTGSKTIKGKICIFNESGVLQMESSVMKSGNGLFSMAVVGFNKKDRTVTVRYTNNLPGGVTTVGYPTTVINGQSVAVKALENISNMNVSTAASSYSDVEYVLNQNFFMKGGKINVMLMTEYFADGNMATFSVDVVLY